MRKSGGIAKANEEEILFGELDFNKLKEVRRIWPFFRYRRIEAYNDILKSYFVAFSFSFKPFKNSKKNIKKIPKIKEVINETIKISFFFGLIG